MVLRVGSAGSRRHPPGSFAHPAPPRILLADADIGVQATLAVTLRGRVLLIDAGNVADALHRLTEAPPRLLILSAWQPDLPASYLLRAVRAQKPGCPALLLTDPDHVEAARELMVLGINGYFIKPLRFDRLFERIMALSGLSRQRSFPRPHLSTPVSTVIQHVSSQYTHNPTVRDLAALVGLSPGHFSHAFSFETGMPPKEYLTRMRIELAKRLLGGTTGSLDFIASKLGFWDASHLSRVFRSRTGQSPGRFRRKRPGAA